MTQQALDHPSAEQLSAFGLGQLGEADSTTVEQHLTVCEPCRQVVDSVAPDSLVDMLKPSTGDAAASGLTEGHAENQTPLAEAATLAGAESNAPASGTTEPALGTVLAEIPAELANSTKYRIEDLLGTGGMGAVYKAEHRLMKRTVALKVINPKFMQSKHAVERFRREVQAAARLHHPNIVAAHDAEQAGDLHFLVMEYVAGTDLSKVLEERGPLSVAEACEYIRQAAVGLQHAHERGMVHRDIKPQNLMVVSGRVVSGGVVRPEPSSSTTHHAPLTTHQVKILDFGLASLTAEIEDDSSDQRSTIESQRSGLTQAGSIMGTPDYMSPEQAKDARSADIRADIYSLGCTLYTLLAGNVPFPGGTAIDKVIAHSTNQPKPLGAVRKDVPASLVRVLDKMMAKDPANRYQTPAEVATALAPLSLVGPGAGDEGRGRRRTLVAVLGAAAAILLAGIIYITTDNGQLVIDTKVDDVEVVIHKGGREFDVIDLKTSARVKRLPSGEYKITLRGNDAGVSFDKQDGFTMTRWGKVVVNVMRKDGADIAKRPATPLEEFLEEYDLAMRWGRGQLNLEEKQRFIALWGHQRSALVNPEDIRLDATLHALEMFGNLPDAAHEELKRTGVLHWRYADLDAARQKAFEALQRKLDRPRKTADALPEHWKQAHVGFMVVEFGGKKAISAFYVLPTHSTWVAVVGGRHSADVAYADAHVARMPQMAREPLSTPLAMLAKDVAIVEEAGLRPALRFDGWDEVTVPTLRLDETTAFTIEAFVVAASENKSKQIPYVAGIPLQIAVRPHETWDVWDFVTRHSGQPPQILATGITPMARGKLTHLAGVRSGDRYRFYVDGKLRGSSSAATPLVARGAHAFVIGKHFSGLIGEVRVSKTARYEKDFTPAKRFEPDADTVALYHFEEDLGNVLIDSSGNGHHGKIVGAKWVRAQTGAIVKSPGPALAPFTADQAKTHQDAWAQHLGIEVETTNSLNMKMRLIPPGEFQMGTAPEEEKKLREELAKRPELKGWMDALMYETSSHRVKLTKPFRIAAHEVTVAQFRRFITATQYKTDAEKDGKGGKVIDPKTSQFQHDPKTNWQNPGPYAVQDHYPVTQVSWEDAKAFCDWLSKEEGVEYRLPTEAEWEFACRAGSTGRYSFGDGFAEFPRHVVGGSRPNPEKVGSPRPNAFGLFDMEGNAWEWCRDWFTHSYNAWDQTDPTGPEAATQYRVHRGGAFNADPLVCRPAVRGGDAPAQRTVDTGFRVVMVGDLKRPIVLPPSATNSALAFDGKSSVVHATAATPFSSSALTIEGWMKPTAMGTYQYRELPWTGHAYRNDTPGQSKTAVGLTYEKQADGSLRWVFRIIAQARFTVLTSTDPCELGKWAHVAAVIDDRKQMALYVNGRQQGASVPAAGLTDKVQCVPFRIGGGDIGKGSFVGEFRAFRLSSSACYDKDFSPPRALERDAQTAALYRFNEGDGDVLRDWSSNGYHGAIAAPRWVRAQPIEESGWTQLFNGKNQHGWHVIGGQPGAWNVVEGLLVGNAGPLPLYTIDRTYSNFHLRMEAKINVSTDLGLYFRLKKPGPSLFHDYFHGYGVGIQAPQMGGKTGGIIKGLKEAVPPAKKVLDDETLHEYFVIEVIARKNRFIVKVNGETTADVVDPDNKYSEGYFGLRQINPGTHVMIKKIEVKELPPTPAAQLKSDKELILGTWRPRQRGSVRPGDTAGDARRTQAVADVYRRESDLEGECMPTIYERVLAERCETLPPILRNFLSCDRASASGRMTVTRGDGWLRKVAAWALGIPPPGEYDLRLEVAPHGAGQRWTRHFGAHTLMTIQSDSRGLLIERKGLASLGFQLIMQGDRLLFQPCKAWVLGVRMPLCLSPQIEAENWPDASAGWRVRVVFRVPLLGVVAEYAGNVVPIANV